MIRDFHKIGISFHSYYRMEGDVLDSNTDVYVFESDEGGAYTMHSTSIKTLDDGTLVIMCSCGYERTISPDQGRKTLGNGHIAIPRLLKYFRSLTKKSFKSPIIMGDIKIKWYDPNIQKAFRLECLAHDHEIIHTVPSYE